MKVNPLTYGDLQTRDEVHDVGEVWASLLWEVYWNLVAKHGFSTNLNNAKQSAGNVVAMQTIIGGMMLQPCNPTFLSARDAIIAADAAHYKGANKCEILKAFAKRGLGPNATSNTLMTFRFHRNVMVMLHHRVQLQPPLPQRPRLLLLLVSPEGPKTATARRTKTTTAREIGTTIFRRTRMTKTATAKKTKTTTTTTTTSAPEPTETCDISNFCCLMLGHYCT
ncbi:hypothetical protein BASA61_003369 [Batrachochytrium salamandrivorans]|nr:hypothetical protein BASA61_003369 [Batrachochytrium salamandrivorans]